MPSSPMQHRLALQVGTYALLIAISALVFFPLVWMVKTSLQSSTSDVMDLRSLVPAFEPTIAAEDFRDPVQLSRALLSGASPIAQSALRRLSPASINAMQSLADGKDAGVNERQVLVSALNELIADPTFYRDPSLSPGAADRIGQQLSEQTAPLADHSKFANRRLLDEAFPALIRPARRWHWSNYEHVVYDLHFARAFANSLLVTGLTTFGLVATSSLAAFAFARMQFFGRDRLFMAYLATMMVPATVTMVPVFVLLRSLHLVDTYWALIVPPIFNAYGVFLLRQFFITIPRDFEEAATLDGCSAFGVYWRVILPLSRPALAALAVLTFIGSWRSFMWPLIATHSREMFTLPLALAQFQELFGVRWTLLMAGSIIMIIPMLLAFILGQRFFVAGIQLGGVKG